MGKAKLNQLTKEVESSKLFYFDLQSKWNHLVFYANEHTDETTLLVESASAGMQFEALTLNGEPIVREESNGSITIGTDGPKYLFTGMIDEVKISTVPEPTTMALLSLGGIAFLMRRRTLK